MQLYIILSAITVAAAYNWRTTQPYGCLVPDVHTNVGLIRHAPASEGRCVPSEMAVDVHFHIASTEEEKHLVTDTIIQKQWKVLHDAFEKQNIHLTLRSTDRVVDNVAGNGFLIYEGPDKGYVLHTKEQSQYYQKTRKGGYDTLNVYFFSPYMVGANGYCEFPTIIAENDTATFARDSCQLNAHTMPGMPPREGDSDEYNRGHLAVHEVGHWFGLNHTFAGGCTEPGDFVDDTPAQATDVYGCPIGSDTCPGQPGLDPIHNFMGYTSDNWYATCSNPSKLHFCANQTAVSTNEFTSGQRKRMFDTFFSYRRKI